METGRKKVSIVGTQVRGIRASRYKEATTSRSNSIKYSNFLVTCNSNYRAKDDDDFEGFQTKFLDVLKDMWENRLDEIVDFSHNSQYKKYAHHVNDRFDQVIKEVRYRDQIEEGTSAKGGRIHSHTLIEIKHTSNIRLNRDAIESILAENFPELSHRTTKANGGWYVNIKLVRDDKHAVLSYIRKTNLHEHELKELFDEIQTRRNLN